MDGDEKRSGGIVTCDDVAGDAGDEAVASGDVAPAPVVGSADPESGGDVTVAEDRVDPVDVEGGPEVVDAVDAVDAVEDVAEPEGTSGEPESGDPTPDAPVVGDATGAEPAADTAARPRRLRSYLRRGAVALAAAGFVAVGVGAFAWATPTAEAADQRFVEAAQSQGHVVTPGEQLTLVVSAARKICDRRVTHDTDQERRATALSTDEIAAVGTAFGADTRDFTTLALETYCSS